eukprot:CAMPEP_0180619848 /NCGR_PEP_ID=MMETSP1037_2-20121125/34307_1 /TAXON_ID=632150 /ORGANISM="Azadinium spinosum, Strain 3D9" /LENGTH=101 /DNA_ID=CAMNT_0022639931 /DNA_START=118 /DNA_END=424 /DNA_ORIENTATION=+
MKTGFVAQAVDHLDAKRGADLGLWNILVLLITAVGEDIRMDDPERLAHGKTLVHAFDRGVHAGQGADEFDSLPGGHEGLALLQHGLPVVVDDDNEFVPHLP